MKKISTLQKGFTLSELALYMGLLIILITILSSIFSSIIDVQLESQSTSSVDLDGRYILAKLIHDMRSMQVASPINDTIVTPSAAGQSSPTLTFTINSINHTYNLNNGNLQITNNNGSNNLNSIDTTISDLQFTRIGTNTSTDTIRINFKVTSKISRNSGHENRTYTTTISAQ